jgi:ectoine hydroxylase-related dioxygenase (phytanoyl-CoA dioxygenase family)
MQKPICGQGGVLSYTMTNLAPFPRDVDLSDEEKDYLFDLLGYRILSNALNERQLKWINDWIDAQPPRQAGEWFGNVEVHSYQGHDGTNYQNIIEGGDVFEELIDNPAWIDDVKRYICNESHGLALNEAFLNVREQSGFIGIHAGGHVPGFVHTTRHHTGKWMVGQINILMALTDVGPGDGATVVVPGSHKSHAVHPVLAASEHMAYRDDFLASDALMTKEVHLKAGEALLFTDGICHGSSARTNPGERRILIYRYSPHVILPRFNYLPSDELMQRLTPARQKIVQPVPPRSAPGRRLLFNTG